jgi:WD40 repeat protein
MMRLWQCVGWAFLLCGVARAAKFTPLETRTNDTIFFSYAQSPDGRWIAGGSQARKDATQTNLPPSGGSVVLWRTEDGGREAVLGDHAATVNWMQFSDDSKTLVSGSGTSGLLKVWSIPDRSLKHTLRLKEPLIASSTLGSQLVCALSPDGKRLAAAGAVVKPVGISQTSEAATLMVWDLVTGQVLWSLPNCGVGTLAFTPDGQTLLAYTRNIIWEEIRGFHSARIADERLMSWNASNGATNFMSPIPGMNPSHLVVSPKAGAVLALSGDRNTWYDLKTGSVAREQPIQLRRSLHVATLNRDEDHLLVIEFSAENLHRVRIADGATSIAGSFKGHTNRVMFASVSSDLKRIAGTRSNRPVFVDLEAP